MTTSEHKPVVVLGVTGCIAAYKACELARALMRSGCRVKVVMTEAAVRFVGPTTFRALTGEPVAIGLWDEADARVHHVSLAEQADVFVIAPATANTIAKVAEGRADDLLSTSVLATEAPVIVAPAMNVHMWRATTTVAAVRVLRERGVTIVEPELGELACGDVGEGRLASLDVILEAVLAEVNRSRDLIGVNVLVTAGGTREAIDPVRFIGNAASGRTGFAIAEEAARRGATVTLVTGPATLPDPFGVSTIRVISAQQMLDAVLREYPTAHVVIASAAVADFRPASSSAHKQKKTDAPLAIELERTPDILALLAAEKNGRVLVGFAAETRDVLESARGKLRSKHLDVVVANDVSSPDVGFASEANRVWFVSATGDEEFPMASKTVIARALWDRVAGIAHEAAQSRAEEGN